MKKILLLTAVILAVGVAAMWGWGKMSVQANNDTLAEIKQAPNVIVLQVDGMT